MTDTPTPTPSSAPAPAAAAAPQSPVAAPAAGGGEAAPAAPPTPDLLADAAAAAGGATSGGDTSGGDSQPAPGADTLGSDTTPTTDEPLPLTTYDAIALPEGMTADQPTLDKFKEFAAKAKLDATAAQSLLDLQAEAMRAQVAAQVAEFTRVNEDWVKEIYAMPEFAAGAKREESLATIGRMFDEFGDPDTRQMLTTTGMGNHPKFVSMMLKVANALNEGKPSAPGRPTGANPKNLSYGQMKYGQSQT